MIDQILYSMKCDQESGTTSPDPQGEPKVWVQNTGWVKVQELGTKLLDSRAAVPKLGVVTPNGVVTSADGVAGVGGYELGVRDHAEEMGPINGVVLCKSTVLGEIQGQSLSHRLSQGSGVRSWCQGQDVRGVQAEVRVCQKTDLDSRYTKDQNWSQGRPGFRVKSQAPHYETPGEFPKSQSSGTEASRFRNQRDLCMQSFRRTDGWPAACCHRRN